MCYAFKQISYWYIYDFLVDILFLRVVTISGRNIMKIKQRVCIANSVGPVAHLG